MNTHTQNPPTSEIKRFLNLARLARSLGTSNNHEEIVNKIRSPEYHGQIEEVLDLIRFHAEKRPFYM